MTITRTTLACGYCGSAGPDVVWSARACAPRCGGCNPATRPGARPAPRTTVDAVETIPPPTYFHVLAGVHVPDRGGLVRCPLPGHDDRTPSCSVSPDPTRGWHCFGCGRGGGVYQLAAGLAGIHGPLRGRDFLDVATAVGRVIHGGPS